MFFIIMLIQYVAMMWLIHVKERTHNVVELKASMLLDILVVMELLSTKKIKYNVIVIKFI